MNQEKNAFEMAPASLLKCVALRRRALLEIIIKRKFFSDTSVFDLEDAVGYYDK